MGLFASIASAVAGPLVSGLFGSKKKETKQTTDFVQLRKSAEAAGFNPLTALKATGGNGFTTTTHPGLSSGEFIGQALGAGLQAWADYDPMQKERDALEMEMMRAELERIKSDTRVAQGFVGGVPSARHEKVPAVAYGAPALGSDGRAPYEAQPASGIPGDEDLLTAQSAEDYFGELPGWGVGLRNLGVLAYRNVFDPMREDRLDPKRPKPRPRRFEFPWRGGRVPVPDAYGQSYVLPPLGSSY